MNLYRLILSVRDYYPKWREGLQFTIPEHYFSEVKVTKLTWKRDAWIRHGPLQCTDDAIESNEFNPYNAPMTLNGWVKKDDKKDKRIADLIIESATELLGRLSEQDIGAKEMCLLFTAMGYLIAERRKLDFSILFDGFTSTDGWEQFNERFHEVFLLDDSVSLEKHPMSLLSHFSLPELRILVDEAFSERESDAALREELEVTTGDL